MSETQRPLRLRNYVSTSGERRSIVTLPCEGWMPETRREDLIAGGSTDERVAQAAKQRILARIARRPGETTSQIARALRIEGIELSQRLRWMEASGAVRRAPGGGWTLATDNQRGN